jgi:hypothetical protein
MAGICTASELCVGGGHQTITVTLDGVPIEVSYTRIAVAEPLSAEELRGFVHLAARRLRGQGVALEDFLNRVLHGDEATNVKSYQLLGPGLAIAKTNIGTAYVNILPGINGERSLVDFTGCTQFRLIASANLVGSGPFGIRVVRDSDDAVLYENASIAVTGERELDTDWQTLPQAASGLSLVRVQAKSVTAADDPVFRRVTMLVR